MNRRKLLSLLGMSPVLLTGNPAQAGQTKHAAAPAADPGAVKITTVNPKGTPPSIQLIPMAPRLDSLDGKTVYLVDTGFHGSDALLHQVELWFNSEHLHLFDPETGKSLLGADSGNGGSIPPAAADPSQTQG